MSYGVDFSMPISFSFEWPREDEPHQQDLFRHYIQSQWIHSSHLADEDPQWQIEAWLRRQPHLQELKDQGVLEIVHEDSATVDYHHRATPQEHLAWRIRWSEQIASQKTSIGVL